MLELDSREGAAPLQAGWDGWRPSSTTAFQDHGPVSELDKAR